MPHSLIHLLQGPRAHNPAYTGSPQNPGNPKIDIGTQQITKEQINEPLPCSKQQAPGNNQWRPAKWRDHIGGNLKKNENYRPKASGARHNRPHIIRTP